MMDTMSAPTPDEVERWTEEVEAIAEKFGITTEQADAGLKWAIADYEERAAAFAKVEEAVTELKVTLGL